jgi:hypothetical protein
MAWKPSALASTAVRDAAQGDRDVVLSMVPSMVRSSAAHWRNPRKVHAAYVAVIESPLRSTRKDAALLVAEDADGTFLGMVLLVAASDCYLHRLQGQVAQVVAVTGQRYCATQIVLMSAAEEWAASRGYRMVSHGEIWSGHPACTMRTHSRS